MDARSLSNEEIDFESVILNPFDTGKSGKGGQSVLLSAECIFLMSDTMRTRIFNK